MNKDEIFEIILELAIVLIFAIVVSVLLNGTEDLIWHGVLV